jgi:hypothetical protein
MGWGHVDPLQRRVPKQPGASQLGQEAGRGAELRIILVAFQVAPGQVQGQGEIA